MINYSIAMRGVNANLFEINQAKSRIKAWATEGHSVAIPGLGSMRFGINATSVEDVNKVANSLITSRKVIFTPNVDIKQELKNTSISITCYDRNGNLVKRVTSTDDGTIEDPDNPSDNPSGGSDGGSGGGSQTPSGGSDSGSGGSQTPSGGSSGDEDMGFE